MHIVNSMTTTKFFLKKCNFCAQWRDKIVSYECSIKIIEGRIRGEKEKKRKTCNRKVINLVDINSTIWMMTLNVNDLNIPINQLKETLSE